MAALDFPDSPTPGQVFDKWTWNGTMWVLTPGGAAGYVFVQETAPTPRKVGDTWFDTSTGATGGTSWVAIEEGAVGSEKVWVQTSPGAGAVPATPIGGVWRRVANQSIANTTATNIFWDTEDIDTHGFLVVNTNTVVIPPGMDGRYALTATGGLAASGVIEIVLASLAIRLSSPANPYSGGATASGVLQLAAGQNIQIQVWQNTGVAVNFTGRLEIWKVD